MQGDLGSRVQKLGKKNKGGSSDLIKTMTLFMKEMHISWAELMDTPIPPFFMMIEVLNKEAKEHEKKMKKK